MVPQWWSGTCGRREQSASTIVAEEGGGEAVITAGKGVKDIKTMLYSGSAYWGKFIIWINAEQGLNSWEKQITVSQNQLEKKEAILKSEELDGAI